MKVFLTTSHAVLSLQSLSTPKICWGSLGFCGTSVITVEVIGPWQPQSFRRFDARGAWYHNDKSVSCHGLVGWLLRWNVSIRWDFGWVYLRSRTAQLFEFWGYIELLEGVRHRSVHSHGSNHYTEVNGELEKNHVWVDVSSPKFVLHPQRSNHGSLSPASIEPIVEMLQ